MAVNRVLVGGVATALLLGFLWLEAEGRALAVEVRTDKETLKGQIPLASTNNGVAYLSLNRLAALLKVKPSWSASSSKAVLKVNGKVVRLIRDRPSVSVQGRTFKLSAPPRLISGEWMVPEEFLDSVLPEIFSAVSVTPVRSAPVKPAGKSPGGRATIADLRFRSYPSFTRVVLEGSGPFRYQVEPGSAEALVRLSGLSLSRSTTQTVGDGLIQEIRLESAKGEGILRVVLASPPGEIKSATLEDPFRLVLDLHRKKEPRAGESPRVQTQPLGLIVLDPGHGGHDPGAIGPSGLQEKDVVLEVTRRLARLVEEGLGVRALMTRDGDHFIQLRERTSYANTRRADLFVSIHANAHRASVSEGVETYFLSSEATDNEARQVAAMENGVVQLEPGYSQEKMDLLRTILWDLAQSEFQEESSRLAETIQDSMVKSLKIPTRGVKQAGFYVLGGAAMPAVLVEIGFLTNRREERKLKDSDYRERIARAIYEGLAEYKRRYDRKMATPQSVEASR